MGSRQAYVAIAAGFALGFSATMLVFLLYSIVVVSRALRDGLDLWEGWRDGLEDDNRPMAYRGNDRDRSRCPSDHDESRGHDRRRQGNGFAITPDRPGNAGLDGQSDLPL